MTSCTNIANSSRLWQWARSGFAKTLVKDQSWVL